MAWVTPKENWISDDVVAHTDFNRIEGNTAYLKSIADYVSEDDFNLTFVTGFTTPSLTASAHYWSYRLASVMRVILSLPLFVNESNTTTLAATGIPSAIYPGTGGANAPCILRVGDDLRSGLIAIGDGGVTFYLLCQRPDIPREYYKLFYKSDEFIDSGYKGFVRQVISYATYS